MKEEILEQLVADYLQREGYFPRHDIRFRPDPNHANFIQNEDSDHSDIGVLGIHSRRRGHDRIVAVTCKIWQAGFSPRSKIRQLERGKRIAG